MVLIRMQDTRLFETIQAVSPRKLRHDFRVPTSDLLSTNDLCRRQNRDAGAPPLLARQLISWLRRRRPTIVHRETAG